MNETKTGCANCWFCRNGQCAYSDKCYGGQKWSNVLQNFVPATYIEPQTNWDKGGKW